MTASTSISPSSSFVSSCWWFLKDLLLTGNCLLCVPMYSMAIWLAIYIAAIVYASTHNRPWLKTLLLLYLPFCIADTRPTHLSFLWGGAISSSSSSDDFSYRVVEWCRSISMYRKVAEWFPVHLVKTCELDPKHSYMFLYHPHGVIGMGASTALSTNGCSFDKVFPGIRRHGVTLNIVFWSPLFREWLLALGMISANKQTLVEALQKGRSIVLVPGGAAEALHAHKDNFRLHLKHRRGFIQLAMQTKALPVPCLGFGENEVFETYYVDPFHTQQQRIPSSLLLYWQRRMYRLFSFSTPIITQPLPNRTPINVVVGAPVVFKEGASVEECHLQYLQALQTLYDTHKAQYGYQDMPIEFV